MKLQEPHKRKVKTEVTEEEEERGEAKEAQIISSSTVVNVDSPVTLIYLYKIRAVKFRLGHLLQKSPRGPGLMFYLPFLDVCHIVDIRLKILKILPHTNVSVCYSSLASVPDVLRLLSFHLLQKSLPPELQHNFAVEAEARRQAQVKVISAEGEKAACEALKASLESLSGSPLVVHLRLLQLLNNLRSEQPAVVLNIPSDVLTQSINLTSLTRPANQDLTAGDGSDDANKDSPMM
uniref:Band 7 domain-containing protein n=1 Tax=Sinocyclocheilus anshuiensis TaxID=1608454 RepID=A0A671NYW9_9TELE